MERVCELLTEHYTNHKCKNLVFLGGGEGTARGSGFENCSNFGKNGIPE